MYGEAYFNLQLKSKNVDLSELNQFLSTNGYTSSLSEDFMPLCLGVDMVFKRFVVGMGFNVMNSKSVKKQNQSQIIYANQEFFIDIGYDLLKNEKLRLYPFVGFIHNSVSLDIRDLQDTIPTNFQEVFDNPSNNATLFQGVTNIDLGLGFNYMFFIGERKTTCGKAKIYLPIGIKTGYNIQYSDGAWHLNNNPLNNSPAIDYSGPYVSINIGYGIKQNLNKD